MERCIEPRGASCGRLVNLLNWRSTREAMADTISRRISVGVIRFERMH
jgi:hypothetical protein